MKISRGNIHGYLGTTLDFSEPRGFNISNILYIEETATYLSKHNDTIKTYATPASQHSFKTREDTIYHNFIARALFYNKIERPEIQTSV